MRISRDYYIRIPLYVADRSSQSGSSSEPHEPFASSAPESMVDFKNLLSPKIIFPVVGVCVLLVVGALVAVFYVRNPTVTDGLFASGDTTGAPDEDRKIEAVTSGSAFGGSGSSYTGGSSAAGSFSADARTTGEPSHDDKGATHENKPLLSSSTTTSSTSSTTTTPRAIEPVNHD